MRIAFMCLLKILVNNGIWKVYYKDVFLGYFNESELRNKEKSTRLETNLV